MFDLRYLGVCSQSNLLDRIFGLHFYQSSPKNYCSNIQYNPQAGMLQIFGTLSGDIIYDASNWDLLIIENQLMVGFI